MYQADEKIAVTTVAPRTGKWHKLAEAIREGCRRAPRQCFNHLFENMTNCNTAESACARGSALLAGMDMEAEETNPSFDCPEGCGVRGGVIHLNDDHRWTRERIADWLDTL